MKRKFRKPLIIMSPKSLLRSKEAVSTLDEMRSGGFREVIDDPAGDEDARTVILCSGKVFYDLNRRRNEKQRSDIAIVRLEQLYPLPQGRIAEVLRRYPKADRHIWVQEEPRNRGGWYFINEHRGRIADQIEYVGRPAAASPATGSYKQHQMELETILTQVFQ
jgi:2-oxoglutarate dehydrogenase E1 component